MPGLTELPLRDIHLPEPISWWPLAFGWWLVLGSACLLLLTLCIVIKRYRKPTLKKEAIITLDRIEKNFQVTDDAAHCLSEISTLLRRAMLSRMHASHVAGVTGEAWLELLDQQLSSQEFSQGTGRMLLNGPYAPRVAKEDVSDLIQLCRRWVNAL